MPAQKIVGYHVGENLQTENVVKAFQAGSEAEKTTGPAGTSALTRGLQYCFGTLASQFMSETE